jgi:hypothetical protein
LLDQNFPPPEKFGIPIHLVKFTHLSDAAPRLVRVHTPDWVVLLFAAGGRYDALVSRDRSQIELNEERVALASTRLSVVTWRRQIDDPVALWGHLLAYLPKIADVIRREGPHIVTLPAIQLGGDNREKVQAFLRRTTSLERSTIPELKSRFRPGMLAELKRRNLHELATVLQD